MPSYYNITFNVLAVARANCVRQWVCFSAGLFDP